MNLSTQSYLYLVVLVITSIINMLVLGFAFGMYGLLLGILITGTIFPISLLMLYHLDYMQSGGAGIWSWVISVLSVLSLVMTTIIMIAASVMTNGNDDKKKQKKKKKDDKDDDEDE